MRLLTAAVVLSTLALFAACSGEPRNAAVGEWDLVSLMVDGVELPATEDDRPVLTLDADVSGNGGCNAFKGQYEVLGDTITFDQVVATERACAGPERNEQEIRFFAVLAAATNYERDGDTFRLFGPDGELLATFEK